MNTLILSLFLLFQTPSCNNAVKIQIIDYTQVVTPTSDFFVKFKLTNTNLGITLNNTFVTIRLYFNSTPTHDDNPWLTKIGVDFDNFGGLWYHYSDIPPGTYYFAMATTDPTGCGDHTGLTRKIQVQ